MAFSAGSRSDLSCVAEAEFGVTPATPTLTRLPFTSSSLNLSKSTLESSELRPDRQIRTARHGNRSVGGDISVEMRVGAYDDFLEGLLGGTWTGDVLEVGTTLHTYTVQLSQTDIDQHRIYTGCAVASASFSIAPDAMVTSTFTMIGRDMSIVQDPLAEPVDAADYSDVVDSFSGTLSEGGTAIAIATSLELNVDNGITPTAVIGSALTPQLVAGRSNVTGTLSAYVENIDLFNKFLNEVESSLEFSVGFGDYSLTFNLPRIKFDGAAMDVSDEGPVVMNMPFRALLDDTEGTNLRITRTFPAP